MAATIDRMREEDWPAVRSIYDEGIATGDATFETAAPGYEEWDRSHVSACRFVAREDGEVVGWSALSPVSGRCAYDGVAEVSVYVGAKARGRGVGGQLLSELVTCSEAEGLWTLQAGILVENAASRALHLRSGFREVGVRERIGELDGRWRDVVLMERRSAAIGPEDGVGPA
jgi:L-amino acid N-acyltransferase YncA